MKVTIIKFNFEDNSFDIHFKNTEDKLNVKRIRGKEKFDSVIKNLLGKKKKEYLLSLIKEEVGDE